MINQPKRSNLDTNPNAKEKLDISKCLAGGFGLLITLPAWVSTSPYCYIILNNIGKFSIIAVSGTIAYIILEITNKITD